MGKLQANKMAGQIDEIKARVDIVDLISEYIRLKQAGTNWRALCPFHNEKSPSFMVSRDKQIWHCFGCSEGGDIFTFVQKIENIEFPEALRHLAQKAGVQLVTSDPQLSNQRTRLFDVCAAGANFWNSFLIESPSAQKARDYLQRRKISDRTIASFKIGYAPDSWDITLKHLKGKGFNDQEIFLAGLTVKKERGNDFYDRFRDRVMFPINDVNGNPIGFSGRTLKPDEKAGKYINTPQTLLYNKSIVVFNLDRAKQEIKKQNTAVMVEGQMDVVSSVQSGVTNVIASSGTALTSEQVKILKRFTNTVAVAFDADEAGQSAAKRGIDVALAEDMNVRVIVLPSGKDPDECIRDNVALWYEAVKKTQSFMEYYFDQTFKRYDPATAEGKKESGRILLNMIAKISNKIEQTHWLQKLSGQISVPEAVLREMLVKQKIERNTPVSQAGAVPKDRATMLSETVLALILKFPTQLPVTIDSLTPEMLSDEPLRDLYRRLIVYYTKDIAGDVKNFDFEQFREQLSSGAQARLADTLILLAEKDFFDFQPDAITSELSKAITFAKKHFYSTRLKELEAKIRQAEQAGRSADVDQLSEQFDELTKLLRALE